MEPLSGRIAGNDKIGIVAEPLQAAIPNISMNIIVDARGCSKKFNVPHGGEDEPKDDNAPGDASFKFRPKFWRSEKLTDR
jgi:hypothetical protein